jgi:predicted lactoylglutathione lyase
LFKKLGYEFNKKLKFDGHWVVTVGQRLKCSSLVNEKFYIEFILGDIAFDIE